LKSRGGLRAITKNQVAVVAAAIVAGLLISPAEARSKKQKRPDAQRRYDVHTQTPSLDGRITDRTGRRSDRDFALAPPARKAQMFLQRLRRVHFFLPLAAARFPCL
jgi:hypothetical protein